MALGEYVYADQSESLDRKEWMQVKTPDVSVHFPVEDLVSRRSFIFARAGFGKSNLNKLLFSELYRTTPVVTKAAGRKAPVGTIIFDPDGEYFWPDDKGRPGLCDVPHLSEQIVRLHFTTQSECLLPVICRRRNQVGYPATPAERCHWDSIVPRKAGSTKRS